MKSHCAGVKPRAARGGEKPCECRLAAVGIGGRGEARHEPRVAFTALYDAPSRRGLAMDPEASRKLETGGDDVTLIKTVRGAGYIFVPTVKRL